MLETAAAGLTCIYDNAGSSQIRAVLDLKERGELPIRFRVDVGIVHFQEMANLG